MKGKQRGLEMWLQPQSAHLACTKPWVQSPTLQKLDKVMHAYNPNIPGDEGTRSLYPLRQREFESRLSYKGLSLKKETRKLKMLKINIEKVM